MRSTMWSRRSFLRAAGAAGTVASAAKMMGLERVLAGKFNRTPLGKGRP